jgi:peptide/nickel transport system permease protein
LSLRSFIARRAAYTIALVFFVIILNWIIFQALPGLTGGIYNILANPRQINKVQLDRLTELYGLNKPYWERFFDYVKALLTFQFGYSYQTGQDITSEMITSGRLVNTLLLIGTSTVLSIIIGVLLGIVAAYKRGSSLDGFAVSASLTTYSLPTFWMGILFILIFSITLGWFPPGAVVPSSWSLGPSYVPGFFTQFVVRLQHLFLPAAVLTLFTYGGFLLLTRATMLESLSEDYIVTARAKGLSTRTILFHHAFKNASLPVITASALSFGGILGGAIITETVFSWAGLGRWLYDAIIFKDYPVMQAMFFIIALGVILANFVADVFYGIVDPRIKYE